MPTNPEDVLRRRGAPRMAAAQNAFNQMPGGARPVPPVRPSAVPGFDSMMPKKPSLDMFDGKAVKPRFLSTGASTDLTNYGRDEMRLRQNKVDSMSKFRQTINGVKATPPPEQPGVVRRVIDGVKAGVKAAPEPVFAEGATQSQRAAAARSSVLGKAAGAVKGAFTGAQGAAAGVPKAGLLARAAGSVGGMVGGAAATVGRIATPATAIFSAGQSVNDMNNGNRDKFMDSIGGESKTIPGMLGQDAMRVMSRFGNNLTGGYAEKLGSAIGSDLAGGGFKAGWNKAGLYDEAPAAGAAAPGRDVDAMVKRGVDAGFADAGKRAADPNDVRAVQDARAMATEAQRKSDNGSGPLVTSGGVRSGSASQSGAARDGGFYDSAKPSDVIGTFNGRNITKAESEYRGGMLPTAKAGTAPVSGPNGSVAFDRGYVGSPAAGNAARRGGGAAGALMGSPEARGANAGSSGGATGAFGAETANDRQGAFRAGSNPQGRSLRGDLSGSDAERQARIKEISDVMGDMSFQGLDMASKRQMFTQMAKMKGDLTGMGYDRATGFEERGAELDNRMATDNADRDLNREQFDRGETWDREKFGMERSDRAAAARAKGSEPMSEKDRIETALKIKAEDRAQENQDFAATERASKYDDGQVEEYMAGGATLEAARERVAQERLEVGEGLGNSRTARVGDAAKRKKLQDKIDNGGVAAYAKEFLMGDAYVPYARGQGTIEDAAQVEVSDQNGPLSFVTPYDKKLSYKDSKGNTVSRSVTRREAEEYEPYINAAKRR